MGFHFVPQDPAVLWQRFLATPYVPHGSDQRPDWMANLGMLVPLGFLATSALWPKHGVLRHGLAGVLALALCIAFVLAVKYLQLYFPGRTVTLNYIMAQSLGSLLGVAVFVSSRRRLARLVRALVAGGREGLMAALVFYTLGLLLFMLLPFDFVMSAGDVRERLAALPHLLVALPGVGRPVAVRAALLTAGATATMPLGMLLALAWPRRSLARITLTGLWLMLGVTALTMLILSATPALLAVGYRTAGILAGAALLRGLHRGSLIRVRWRLAGAVPWLVLPYLVLLVFFNGLLTSQWRSPEQALAALNIFGLIPLYHDYIVPKSEAAKSLVAHFAMYAPIGVMIWLRHGADRHQAITGGVLAALCSLGVELGRWMKPGLQPDFNEVVFGGLAAGLTIALLPRVWRLLEQAVEELQTSSAADATHSEPRQLWRSASLPWSTATDVGRHGRTSRALPGRSQHH